MNRHLKEALVYLLLILITIVIVYPFYSMMIMGTHSTNAIFEGIKLLPGDRFFSNFAALKKAKMEVFYGNSLKVAVVSVLLGSVSSLMAGLALAKYDFRGRGILSKFIFLTLILPTSLGIVAFVIEMRQFGWFNTYYPLMLPSMANSFCIFYIQQYAKDALPVEVMESARIDGCSEYRLLAQVCVPMMLPAVTTVVFLIFLGSWNNFLTPYLLLSKEKLYTLPLGIKTLTNRFMNNYPAEMLGLAFGTIPSLILFSIFSKSLIGGLTASAVKG